MQTFEWLSIVMMIRYQLNKSVREIFLTKLTTNTKSKSVIENFVKSEYKMKMGMKCAKYLFLLITISFGVYFYRTLNLFGYITRVVGNTLL